MSNVRATPYARKIARQYHIDLSAVRASHPDGAIRERDIRKAREQRTSTPEASITPLAQRMAEAMHIDLSQVRGTGIGGRISKADVLAASGQRDIELQPGELRKPMNAMRRAIAAAMTEAAQIPTVTVTTKVDVTRLTELRLAHNEKSEIHYTVNDLILMACAKALPRNKRILCSAAGENIIYKNAVNLGISVSFDEGVIVPVLRDADRLEPNQFVRKTHDLIRRTREKKISPDECRGATFTVTNMGMYSVEAFTPILNLPCAAILGVCSIYNGCAVKEGAVEVRKLMHICLTFDHRLLDGADAAKFNLSVKEYLEHPEGLFAENAGDH